VDPNRRIAYLQVLGVDVWLPRRPNAAAAPPEAPLPASGFEAPAQTLSRASSFEAQAASEFSSTPFSPVGTPSAEAKQSHYAKESARPVSNSPSPAPLAPVPSSDAEAEELWSALKAEVKVCTKCTLHTSRTQTVFGVGDQRADWLVIGEAPGAEEDRRGEPFVGRGGQLLDAMLRGISLKRGDNVYIANILKSRPPNNRDPKPEEVSACIPFLMRQIALIRPKLILAVGRIAAQNLLATDAPLTRLRGKVHHFGELNTPLIVTYHPAYLLRSPGEKRKAWEDLKFARGLYRQLTAQAS
jgi:uracil-DNA glycosylase